MTRPDLNSRASPKKARSAERMVPNWRRYGWKPNYKKTAVALGVTVLIFWVPLGLLIYFVVT